MLDHAETIRQLSPCIIIAVIVIIINFQFNCLGARACIEDMKAERIFFHIINCFKILNMLECAKNSITIILLFRFMFRVSCHKLIEYHIFRKILLSLSIHQYAHSILKPIN